MALESWPAYGHRRYTLSNKNSHDDNKKSVHLHLPLRKLLWCGVENALVVEHHVRRQLRLHLHLLVGSASGTHDGVKHALSILCQSVYSDNNSHTYKQHNHYI
eukprot:GHVR01099797.1.p1 GENE.GHVR01099797.1~~GHVR01099797.1.p1  ORF type:complete len:103 (+),score=16.92 GHVR01099797.1:366-674(+)